MSEKLPNSIREVGCWSDNVAQGYLDAVNSLRGQLHSALEFVDVNLIRCEEHLKNAQRYLDEANRCFNVSNNSSFRTRALISEIKALRSGQSVSYASGDDPTDENWERKP